MTLERTLKWIRTPLFGLYLGDFVILYGVTKTANVALAAYLNKSPHALHISLFAFRPLAEIGAFLIELIVLRAYLRRGGEDILLGNLGVSDFEFAGCFACIHGFLSLALTVLPA